MGPVISRGAEPCVTAMLLAALTRGLSVIREPRLVRQRFEEELRVLVNADTITLRDERDAPVPLPGTISLEVPGPPFEPRQRIEVTFDPARQIDPRTQRMLSAAASIAGLLVEIERANGRWPLSCARSRVDGAAPLIGRSREIRLVRERIEKVAVTDFIVLIEGESGTGKELVAQQIHDLSRRRHGPFVAVNCAALVETLLEAELFGIEERTATGVRGRRGKFEHADGGTLFLDEVSDLSVSAQAKLLRAIQDLAVERVGGHGTRAGRHPDRRRHQPPARGHGRARNAFRADLFYRLCGVDVHVPPLRERQRRHPRARRVLPRRHHHTRRLELSPSGRDALCAVRLARQRARARARRRERGGARRRETAWSSTTCRRRSAASSRRCCCPRSARTTRCARGGAATRGWCWSAATTTSARLRGARDQLPHAAGVPGLPPRAGADTNGSG